MTVPSTARRAGPFSGNGVATSFSFSFKTFAAGDLVVTRTSSVGVETTLVKDSDYSVSLNGDQDTSPGGSITYPISGSPLASGEQLTITSALAYEQTTDLLGGGAFNARVIEDTFDRMVIQIQQLDERADRTLTLPVGSTASAALPAPEALNLLAWNATADGVQNVNPASLLTVAGSSGFATQLFSGNGSTTAFTLTENPGFVANVEVFISGVRQSPVTDYTVSNTTLTFVSAPPAGTSNILVRWGQTLGVGVPGDGSVTAAKLSGSLIRSGTTQPATSGTAVEFTDVPAWAKRIRLQLFGLSTNGTSRLLVQLGTASGWVTSGYTSCAMYNSGTAGAFSSASNGFLLEPTNAGATAAARAGVATLEVADGNRWVFTAMTYQGSSVFISSAAGRHEVASVNAVRIIADNGTDIFDAGPVGITYE